MKKLLFLISNLLFSVGIAYSQANIKHQNNGGSLKQENVIHKHKHIKTNKKNTAIIHSAPNQQHIDSIKKEKLKAKK